MPSVAQPFEPAHFVEATAMLSDLSTISVIPLSSAVVAVIPGLLMLVSLWLIRRYRLDESRLT